MGGGIAEVAGRGKRTVAIFAFRINKSCHPGSLAEAVRDLGDWASAVRPPLGPGQALRAFRDDNF
jgi:hypothetical protein